MLLMMMMMVMMKQSVHKPQFMISVQTSETVGFLSSLLDPEYGMLYLQNSDMTSALDSLDAN